MGRPVIIVELPPRQKDDLKDLSEKTGLSMSELVRRMIDQCSFGVGLGNLIPAMSGSVRVGG